MEERRVQTTRGVRLAHFGIRSPDGRASPLFPPAAPFSRCYFAFLLLISIPLGAGAPAKFTRALPAFFPAPPSWNPAGFLLFSLLTAFRIYFRLVPSDYFVPTRVPRSRYGPSGQQGSGKLRPILAMIGRGFLESSVPNRFFKSF